jgi:hypothetical protein
LTDGGLAGFAVVRFDGGVFGRTGFVFDGWHEITFFQK